MRGISWLAAKTGQLLKKDAAPWSKLVSDKEKSVLDNPTIFVRFYTCNVIISVQLKAQIFCIIIVTRYTL
jgi:hypothetical protein